MGKTRNAYSPHSNIISPLFLTTLLCLAFTPATPASPTPLIHIPKRGTDSPNHNMGTLSSLERTPSLPCPLSSLNSPATQLPCPLHSGTQVSLNGKNLPVAWSQWQIDAATGKVRTAISDMGVTKLLGVELLNVSNAAKQPVKWFSQPTATPLVLSSWLSGGYRYLDITQLAVLAGWQISTHGDTLRITTPKAKVQAIRQGQQSWGNRVVIDLDRPTPWQVKEVSRGAREWAIAIDANQTSRGEEDSLPFMRVERNQFQTTIRLSLPIGLLPRVSTLANPHRIVIDIRPDPMVDRDILWAPGLRWRQQFVSLGASRFPVVWLEINPRTVGLTLKPIVSEPTTLVGIAPLLKTAQRYSAVAAINGGFFNRNNKLPLGAIRRDGRWLSSPILNRGVIAWNDAGDVKIGRLSIQETLNNSNGQHLPLVAFNSGYVKAGIARYSSEWGPGYTPLIDDESIVVVQNNQVTAQLPGGTAGKNTFPIPPNGYLLALRANKNAAKFLSVGTIVSGGSVTAPDYFARYPHVLGAGPVLLKDRQIVLDAKAEGFSDAFIRETATRSAIGTTVDGTLLITAVNNRQGGAGPTLAEVAKVMQQLGCVDALNFDGGSSTSLYLGGELLNRLPHTAARVHNGLGIFLSGP